VARTRVGGDRGEVLTMRAQVLASLTFLIALAGCPALLSDWTISGSGGHDASADTSNPDAAGGGSSSGSGSSSSSSSGSTSGSSSGMDAASADAPGPDAAGPSCPDGGSTTISGTVYDPAGKNPVYNVAVYVPNSAPETLPSGVTCASCSDLYTTPIASAVTDASGSFTIKNAPSGPNIPLIVQVGKWRMTYNIANVANCQANPQPNGMLHLPANHMEGNIPDIAISTGGADSLECLPLRMGIDPAEYVPGASTSGRIHIFQGYMGATTSPAAPASYTGLWSSDASFKPFDVILLSCEGAPTTGGGPALTTQDQQYLLDYANEGGRVFASHFHYAWFTSGPFTSIATPPLMTWTAATLTGSSETIDDGSEFFAAINQTTVGGSAFPEGVALQTWLGNVGALVNGELPFFYARDNVVSVNAPAQTWMTLDKSKLSADDVSKLAPDAPSAPPQYLSFDLPLNVGSASSKCGRVVYSDLHVSGGPGANEPVVEDSGTVPADYGTGGSAGIVPTGCAMHALTPQEKALEFMIFDLSSCLIPIGQSTTL
jgi:hypothetical protein